MVYHHKKELSRKTMAIIHLRQGVFTELLMNQCIHRAIHQKLSVRRSPECRLGKQLSTQMYLYCAMLMIDMLSGIQDVTVEHMNLSYMTHMAQSRAHRFWA